MSIPAIKAAMEAPIKGAEKAVLIALAWHLNAETGQCDPSAGTLMLNSGVSLPTLRLAMKRLEAAGYIRKTEHKGARNSFEITIPSKDSNPVKNFTPSKTLPRQDLEGEGGKDFYREGGKDFEGEGVKIFTPKERKRNIKEKRKEKIPLPYKSLPLKWWIECREINSDLNPARVWEDFSDYWTSDSAAGKGLKSDWDRTWRNWIRKTASEWLNFRDAQEIRDFFERLYRNSSEKIEAEKYFLDKTGLSNFGYSEIEKPEWLDPDADAKGAEMVRGLMGGLLLQDRGEVND